MCLHASEKDHSDGNCSNHDPIPALGQNSHFVIVKFVSVTHLFPTSGKMGWHLTCVNIETGRTISSFRYSFTLKKSVCRSVGGLRSIMFLAMGVPTDEKVRGWTPSRENHAGNRRNVFVFKRKRKLTPQSHIPIDRTKLDKMVSGAITISVPGGY